MHRSSIDPPLFVVNLRMGPSSVAVGRIRRDRHDPLGRMGRHERAAETRIAQSRRSGGSASRCRSRCTRGERTFRRRRARPGSELLVVVSSLSRERGPFSVQLAARPASRRRFLSSPSTGFHCAGVTQTPDREAPDPSACTHPVHGHSMPRPCTHGPRRSAQGTRLPHARA